MRLALAFAVLVSSPAYATDVRRIEDAQSIHAHAESIAHIALSPRDGNLAATASTGGEIALWDLTTLSPYWKATVADSVSAVQFSTSGNLLAAGGQCKLMLFSLATGLPVQGFDIKDARSTGCNINWDEPDLIRFSKTDLDVFAGYPDRVFHLNRTTGAVEWIYGDPFTGDRFWGLKDLQLSFDEKYFYMLDEEKWSAYVITTHELARTFKLSEVEGMSGVRFKRGSVTRDGSYTVVSDDVRVYVIDNTFKKVIRKFLAAADTITTAKMTDDLCCVMIASADGTTRVWEVATGLELSRLDDQRPSRDRPWQMAAASPKRQDVILTGDAEGNVWVWKP